MKKTFETLYTVRLLKNRVSTTQNKIDERVDELTKRLLNLQARGENYLAKRYAEEVAKLKNLSRRLEVLSLVIEKIDVALQYAIVYKEFANLSRELKELFNDISKLPETKIPELNLLFAELLENAKELSGTMERNGTFSLEYSPVSNSEVSKILEEAKVILKQKLEPVNDTI